MAGKPVEPSVPRETPAHPSEQTQQAPDGAERAGPLLVERMRKADGRALILYRASDRASGEHE